MLDSADTEHPRHCREFCWTEEGADDGGEGRSPGKAPGRHCPLSLGREKPGLGVRGVGSENNVQPDTSLVRVIAGCVLAGSLSPGGGAQQGRGGPGLQGDSAKVGLNQEVLPLRGQEGSGSCSLALLGLCPPPPQSSV